MDVGKTARLSRRNTCRTRRRCIRVLTGAMNTGTGCGFTRRVMCSREMAGGGFEPGDIGKLLVAALKADRPLPENRAGVARLAAAVITVTKPPTPKSIAPLPEMAR